MFGQLTIVLIVVCSTVSAGIAGITAWKYQAHRYEAEKAELYRSAQSALRVQEKRYAEQFQKAAAQSAERSRSLRRDADSARRESDGLRNALAAATAGARDTPSSCPDTASTLGKLLDAVEAEGRAMAEICDGHANDVRTLIEAWPK